MQWSNVKLIFSREVRDQLRDRRTLFTIAVLPLLLYPLLGMSFLRVAQFMHEQPMQIWFVGTANMPDKPELIEQSRFLLRYCPAHERKLLELHLANVLPNGMTQESFPKLASKRIRNGEYAAVVLVPKGFAEALSSIGMERRDGAQASGDSTEESAEPDKAIMPQIIFDASSDRSRIAQERLWRVLTNWRRVIVRQNVTRSHLSPALTDPFQIQSADVSEEFERRAAVWSKILPFVLLIWALTGAFYPAIDLCAGEKERGTLETLLSSPAKRSEIVWGKLLTITIFSMATAILNLVSLGATGTAIVYLQPAYMPFGTPPLIPLIWLLLALVPVSALFSALALAIAAFARSTKEGQYYLMPLLLVSLPLMILPMLPTAQLTLGTSLIPITGLMLLLRALVEGQYFDAVTFAPPVIFVTSICCLLSIRWAIDQFNNESVLFRESEQWSLRHWLRRLVRDRGPTPTFAQAVSCGLLLLLIHFFAAFAASKPESWPQFAVVQAATLIGMVALPAVLMALFLTRKPTETLLLKKPKGFSIFWAGVLAVTLHPAAMLLADGVQRLYPIQTEVHNQMAEFQQIIAQAPSFWYILALMALLPALCEELAFRGFILSGLRHMGHKWAAIVLSSVFFGLTHGILQQSISATLLGIVIGYVAVQTGSLLPGITFHLIYNSLSLLIGFQVTAAATNQQWLHWIFTIDGQQVSYRPPIVIAGVLLAGLALRALHGIHYKPTVEEALQEALEHQTARVAT